VRGFKLGVRSKYYLSTFLTLFLCMGLFNFFNFAYVDIIFFITAYVWHLALLTPGLKEMVLRSHHRLSFLAMIMRFNHYLQIFINVKNIPFLSSLIRSISPLIFTLFVYVISGESYVLFTVLGSVVFEMIYFLFKKYVGQETSELLKHRDDLEIPLEKSNEEI
jgi:hypothetical protein